MREQHPETLIHYSARPLERVESREQEAPHSYYSKPNGLWVSVLGEMDWREWCTEADFNLAGLALAHQITLHPKARILRVRSAMGIDRLTAIYGIEPSVSIVGKKAIDWPRIAKRYAGIIIAPYIWQRRMDMDSSWYYVWDCASGCIWDANAVLRVDKTYNP